MAGKLDRAGALDQPASELTGRHLDVEQVIGVKIVGIFPLAGWWIRLRMREQVSNQSIAFAFAQDVLNLCAESQPCLFAKLRPEQLFHRVRVLDVHRRGRESFHCGRVGVQVVNVIERASQAFPVLGE